MQQAAQHIDFVDDLYRISTEVEHEAPDIYFAPPDKKALSRQAEFHNMRLGIPATPVAAPNKYGPIVRIVEPVNRHQERLVNQHAEQMRKVRDTRKEQYERGRIFGDAGGYARLRTMRARLDANARSRRTARNGLISPDQLVDDLRLHRGMAITNVPTHSHHVAHRLERHTEAIVNNLAREHTSTESTLRRSSNKRAKLQTRLQKHRQRQQVARDRLNP